MIPPIMPEEQHLYLPRWAITMLQEDLHRRIPKVVGLPVYDVLYGTKYDGRKARGIVSGVTRHAHPDHDQLGVKLDGGACSSMASYWVPDITTAEGWQHVQNWLRGQ